MIELKDVLLDYLPPNSASNPVAHYDMLVATPLFFPPPLPANPREVKCWEPIRHLQETLGPSRPKTLKKSENLNVSNKSLRDFLYRERGSSNRT